MSSKLFPTKKKTTKLIVVAKSTPSVVTPAAPVPNPKPKFSAEDEAKIQAEVDRVKAAKHAQMIAEEIQNRINP